MRKIVIKLEGEDKTLIVLCSLHISLDNFVNSMLYGKDKVPLAYMIYTMNSKELRTELNRKGMDNQAEGLFVKSSSSKGRPNEGSKGSRGKSRGSSHSKFNKKNVKCHYYHIFNH